MIAFTADISDALINDYRPLLKLDIPVTKNPLVARAHAVFNRVKNVADKNHLKQPEMLIIDKGPDSPTTFSDGMIVLPLFILQKCYENVQAEDGDSRLALILGHEFAHLARDHFWGHETYHAFETYLRKNDDWAILEILEKTEDLQIKTNMEAIKRAKSDDEKKRIEQTLIANAKEIRKKKELEADSYGIWYMLLAGYNPMPLISNDSINFFAIIDSALKATYEMYPQPDARKVAIRSKINQVIEKYDLFQIGVRLYQLEDYETSIPLFKELAKSYPSREVFNNIGASYYQLALKRYSICREEDLFRFKLSVDIDPTSPAEKIVLMGPGEGDICENKPEFKEYINLMNEAVDNFKKATEMDTAYSIAMQNYIAALIWAKKYSLAAAYADELLSMDSKNITAMSNKAIAKYLEGEQQKAVELLNKALSISPDFPDAMYNLATILSETKGEDAAKEVWNKFLQIESKGIYAKEASKKIKKELPVKPTKHTTLPLPDMKPGDSISGLRKKFPCIQEKDFEKIGVKQLDIKILQKDNIKAIAIDNTNVDYVEKDILSDNEKAEGWLKKYGTPQRVVILSSGKTYIYKNGFGFDEINGKVKKVFWFSGL